MRTRDKYLKIVEWSKNDDCYIGSIPGFLGPCCHGDNEAVVYKQLCKILDEWIDIHEQEKLPLPEEKADNWHLYRREAQNPRYVSRIEASFSISFPVPSLTMRPFSIT